MEKRFKNYIIYLSVITLVMMVVYFIVKQSTTLSPQAAYIIPAFFIITLVSHLLLVKAMGKDPKKFYINFIGAMALKMLASFAFLTIMFLVFKGLSVDFVAVFMIVYLVYTVFEMIYLRPLTKKKS